MDTPPPAAPRAHAGARPDTPPTTAAVRQEYARRLDARRTALARLTRTDAAVANGRLAAFGAIILTLWVAYGFGTLIAWWVLVPAAIFLALIVRHDRIIGQRDRAALAVRFYEQGLARLDGTWPGHGVGGARFIDAAHPCSSDLDLFGRGSLFELLCVARTRAGEDCLADRLRSPATAGVVRSRQEAVRELRGRLDLREELALLGDQASSEVDPRSLAEWGAGPSRPPSPARQWSAVALGACGAAAVVLWFAGFGLLPLLGVMAAEAVFAAGIRRQVRDTLKGVEGPTHDLALLGLVLERFEHEPFAAPLLRHLQADLQDGGDPPSARIARLKRHVDYLHAAQNPLVAPLAGLLMWHVLCAFAIERWRGAHGPSVARWIMSVGEFEALCSLAGYAYERPEDPFPDLADEGVVLEAQAVAHPLLPTDRAIANDVRLEPTTGVLIVSGSNMSGKSTLLRAVGVNTVLALAGAPVRARSLRLSYLQVGASMRTVDSLQAGVSHFYAEIARLKQIVDLASAGPTLFLLDEILHGTNSHDRLVGAEAVVRTLVRKGAVGLVTTHDLALARLADDAALHAVNVHFEDQVVEGKMAFDYRLRPGPIDRGNALELMRAVGLEV